MELSSFSSPEARQLLPVSEPSLDSNCSGVRFIILPRFSFNVGSEYSVWHSGTPRERFLEWDDFFNKETGNRLARAFELIHRSIARAWEANICNIPWLFSA